MSNEDLNSVVVDDEDIDVDDSIDYNNLEIVDDEDIDFGDDDETVEEPKEPETKPTTKTFTQEDLDRILKKERKKYENKFSKKSTSSNVEPNMTDYFESRKAEHMKRGMNEESAEFEAKRDVELKELKDAISGTSKNQQVYARQNEIKELKKNPLYSDIEEHTDEINELADRTGLTAEQCYNALFAPRRYKDAEQIAQQRNRPDLINNRNINVGVSDGQVQKKGVQISPEEQQMARMLGMSDKEFLIANKTTTFDNYKKLINKIKPK